MTGSAADVLTVAAAKITADGLPTVALVSRQGEGGRLSLLSPELRPLASNVSLDPVRDSPPPPFPSPFRSPDPRAPRREGLLAMHIHAYMPRNMYATHQGRPWAGAIFTPWAGSEQQLVALRQPTPSQFSTSVLVWGAASRLRRRTEGVADVRGTQEFKTNWTDNG